MYATSIPGVVSRRSFLAGAVAAGALLTSPRIQGADDMPGSGEGWIDAHSHIWTPDVEKYPLAPPSKREDLDPPSFTGDELLALAEPLGVRRVVLIQHHIYHGYDNTYLIDETARHPGRFRVVGMVDDLNADA